VCIPLLPLRVTSSSNCLFISIVSTVVQLLLFLSLFVFLTPCFVAAFCCDNLHLSTLCLIVLRVPLLRVLHFLRFLHVTYYVCCVLRPICTWLLLPVASARCGNKRYRLDHECSCAAGRRALYTPPLSRASFVTGGHVRLRSHSSPAASGLTMLRHQGSPRSNLQLDTCLIARSSG
jgi:hypothetical protein